MTIIHNNKGEQLIHIFCKEWGTNDNNSYTFSVKKVKVTYNRHYNEQGATIADCHKHKIVNSKH
jgi:hypothetical protein